MLFLFVGVILIAINVGLYFFLMRFLLDKRSRFLGLLALILIWLWIWPGIPPLNLVSIAGSLLMIYGITSLLSLSLPLTLLSLGGTAGLLILVASIRAKH